MKGCETIKNVFMLEKKKEDYKKCYSLNVHLKKTRGKEKRK